MWNRKEIEDNYPFFEIRFPDCAPLVCKKREIWEFINEAFDYLELGQYITIGVSQLTVDELLDLPEHIIYLPHHTNP